MRKKAGSKVKSLGTAKSKIDQPSVQEALANLEKIEHIVVLMMENRSFDHILGYLSLEKNRQDVDGLKKGMSNNFKGKAYPIYALKNTALQNDPCHDGQCVTEQVSNSNGGFVTNFANHCPKADPGEVMGYYNTSALPVYDHLAQEFCVCNRWYSSVPGSTWPNRLYAVSGKCDGNKNNKTVPIYNIPSFVRHLARVYHPQ